MIVCKHCGFRMCTQVEEGLLCPQCISEHNYRHDQWATGLYANGVPPEAIPGPEWVNTSDSSFTMPKGQTPNPDARMCNLCEQRVNTTNHICTGAKGSIDAKTFISELKVKE